MKLKFLFVFLLLPFVFFIFSTSQAAQGDIYIIEVADAISPGTAEFIQNSIAKAEAEQAACIIIELDTPGGLAESMRLIVQDILGCRVPVVVYVSPPGARAASAGVMITMAADIAAMAPGTNIGAAHPVGAGGKDISGKMSEKVINDMVAQAKSVAEERGRNKEWVEQAIRESVSVTETEALKENIIDLVATDLAEAVITLFGLAQGYLERTSLVLRPLLQGQAHLPLVDAGIALAQPIVAFSLQAHLQALDLGQRFIQLLL